MEANLFTEEHFRLLFEAAPHGYLVILPDAAFTIAEVNGRYLAATGTKREDLLGRGLFEVVPGNPGDEQATGVSDLRSSLERVKRELVTDVMGVQRYDIPTAGGDGTFAVKYWSPVNTPVPGEDGGLRFIIHHVEDVTEFILSRERAAGESNGQTGQALARRERMEAEALLRAAEVKEANRQLKAAMEELARREHARLKASFDEAAVGMAHVSLDGRWLRVNERLCSMTGYTREELLAKTFQDITHPDDLSGDSALLQQLLAGQVATYRTEKRYCRKDGGIVWVKITASLVHDADGAPPYVVRVIDDITARKQTEIALAESNGRLAGLVDSAMDAIISVDSRQNIVFFNRAAEKMFQWKAGDILGKPLAQLIPQRFAGPHTVHVDGYGKTGVSNRSMGNLGTLAAVRADGTEFPIEASISQTSAGGEKLFTAIVRDITGRKRAEDTQRLLLAELDHRVKNTLATVQAIARQTLNAAADPVHFVESFNGRVQALGRAHGLLTRSNWQGAELAALIEEQLLFNQADDGRLSCCGPIVLLEPQAALHLGLVLHELGTNARKYGSLSRPEGRLRTNWSVTDGASPELKLNWVESDGPPVTAPTRRGFGTTLIERSLHYALGGEAELHFAPGGLTCEIRLPLPSGNKGAYARVMPERSE